jgi:alpha-tubulin suppressor-like RCC1 family protein
MKASLVIVLCLAAASLLAITVAIPFDSGKDRPTKGRLLYGWGRDNFNQLAQGDDVPPRESNAMPTLVNTKIFLQPEENGYVHLSKVFAGAEFGYALASTGNKVYSWGRNDKGQLAQSSFTPASSFGVSRITQDRLMYIAFGNNHVMSVFDTQPGASLMYDSFFGAADAFEFNGFATPELLTPNGCPKCLPWSESPFSSPSFSSETFLGVDNKIIRDGYCGIPAQDTYPASGQVGFDTSSRASDGLPWCYIPKGVTCPGVRKQVVPAGSHLGEWRWVYCLDAGSILASGLSLPRQVGSFWSKTKLPIYQAFETSFTFKIGENDLALGGGDGIQFVLQNSHKNSSIALKAIGGIGSDMGAAKGTRVSFLDGISNAVGVEVDTFDDTGFEVRTCKGYNALTFDNSLKRCTVGQISYAGTLLKNGLPGKGQGQHNLRISYAPYQLELFLDFSLILRIPFDIETAVLMDPTEEGSKAFAGFTSATGDAHSYHKILDWKFLSLSQTGSIRSAGFNLYGQLGLQDQIDRNQPNLIKSFSENMFPMVSVSCGSTHSIAITSLSEVYSWGGNQFGQLGQGDFLLRLLPTKVRRISLAIESVGVCPPPQERSVYPTFCCPVIAATSSFSSLVVLLIKEAGVFRNIVYGWGDNTFGQIGIMLGADGASHNPIIEKEWSTNAIPYSIRSFDGASNKFGLIVDLKCGQFHCVSWTDKDELLVWGWNLRGQLGFKSNDDSSPIVRNIRSSIKSATKSLISKVAVGGYHNVALMSDGTVWSWGSNYFGQLGLGIEVRAHSSFFVPQQMFQQLFCFTHIHQVQPAPMTLFKPSSPRKTMFAPVLIPKFSEQNRTIVDVAAGLYHSYAIAECTGLYVLVFMFMFMFMFMFVFYFFPFSLFLSSV